MRSAIARARRTSTPKGTLPSITPRIPGTPTAEHPMCHANLDSNPGRGVGSATRAPGACTLRRHPRLLGLHLLARVLLGVEHELLVAIVGAEAVGLACVLRLGGRRRGLDFLAADRVLHGSPPSVSGARKRRASVIRRSSTRRAATRARR